MSEPTLSGFLDYFRSAEARPLLRESIWAGGGALALILLAALISPALAYAVYLAVAVFFAAVLTAVFASLLERETGERVVQSPQLRRWLGVWALVLGILAALILV